MLFVAYSLYVDVGDTGMKTTTFFAVPSSVRLPSDRARLRVRQRLPRHRQRRRHGHLHALAEPHVAVVWSGLCNFIGVLLSSGAVAVRHHHAAAGRADPPGRHRRRLRDGLRAAGRRDHLESGTWYLGLPASSSHTLIGSIIGVGVANQLMQGQTGTSGVDWSKATEIGYALLLSPVFGFVVAALLLLALKFVSATRRSMRRRRAISRRRGGSRGTARSLPAPAVVCPRLQRRPEGYGPHHAHSHRHGAHRLCAQPYDAGQPDGGIPDDVGGCGSRRPTESRGSQHHRRSASRGLEYVSRRKIDEGTYPRCRLLIQDIAKQVAEYGTFAEVPSAAVGNTRNDIYLASEAIRFLMKDKENDLTKDDVAKLSAYKKSLDTATKFIPLWVKVAVAIALGLGTMIGWKRIVITVGEKIGKAHMTYGQGACAELVAAGTIAAADVYGLPVSATHVLSSGVAGTMAANGSGLQWATVRNLLMAWVLTLPAGDSPFPPASTSCS